MTSSSVCELPTTSSNNTDNNKALFGRSLLNGQALSLFRIGFALLLFYDLFAHIIPTWDFFLTSYGTLTAPERDTVMIWSLLTYSDNPIYQNIFLTTYIFSIFCLLIGFRTRFFCFLTLIGYASIVDRNLLNDSNVEALTRALLLWSCFLPLDRFWSIAAAFRNDDDRNKPWPIIPALAIKIQIIIVYFYSGLFKLSSDDWTFGKAITYAVSDQFYGTELGSHAVTFIPESLGSLLCWGVIIFQLIFSALIYSPYLNNFLRGLALAGALVMHLSFLFLLQVGIFPFLCMAYLLLLIPDRWINALLHKRRERLSRIRIYYDPDCGFCLKIARLLREFCLETTTPVRPASDDAETLSLLRKTNSWVVYGSNNEIYLKWNAVSYVLRQSPLFWIFGFISGSRFLSKPMEHLYDLIGNNRHRLGKIFSPILSSPLETPPSIFAQWVCLTCLTVCLIFSTLSLPQAATSVPLQVSAAAHQLGVIQNWNLFAPIVPRWQYYFQITARDKNGYLFNINPLLEAHYSRDESGFYTFNGHRLLKFYSRTFEPQEQKNRAGLARYLCYKTRENGHAAAIINMYHWRNRNYTPTPETDTYISNFQCKELLGDL